MIEDAIALRLNALTGEVDLPAETDALLAVLSGQPGFTQWAKTVAAREAIQERLGHGLSVRRNAASRKATRVAIGQALHGVDATAKAGRAAGKSVTEIRNDLLDSAYCVDERAGRWLPLRSMTADDLTTVAGLRERQGQKLLMTASFLRTVARKLKPTETVEDRWSETALAKVLQGLGASRQAVA